jgi:hypothetical protein
MHSMESPQGSSKVRIAWQCYWANSHASLPEKPASYARRSEKVWSPGQTTGGEHNSAGSRRTQKPKWHTKRGNEPNVRFSTPIRTNGHTPEDQRTLGDVQTITAAPEATNTQKEDNKQNIWTQSSRQEETGTDTAISAEVIEESILLNQRPELPAGLFVRDQREQNNGDCGIDAALGTEIFPSNWTVRLPRD